MADARTDLPISRNIPWLDRELTVCIVVDLYTPRYYHEAGATSQLSSIISSASTAVNSFITKPCSASVGSADISLIQYDGRQ